MTSICVGCPISNRRWAMTEWYERAYAACDVAGLDPHFVFVQTENDDSLHDLTFDDNLSVITVDEPMFVSRKWGEDRYAHMVYLRNLLLEKVRAISPDFFLSVDSDIMLNDKWLLDAILRDDGTWDALGGKVYLAPNRRECPSYANLGSQGNLIRPDQNGFFKVQVIMALKLMKPSAYNVDYIVDKRGEDIGWSKECASRGLSLYWNGMYPSKHIFEPEMMGVYDERVGY